MKTVYAVGLALLVRIRTGRKGKHNTRRPGRQPEVKKLTEFKGKNASRQLNTGNEIEIATLKHNDQPDAADGQSHSGRLKDSPDFLKGASEIMIN